MRLWKLLMFPDASEQSGGSQVESMEEMLKYASGLDVSQVREDNPEKEEEETTGNAEEGTEPEATAEVETVSEESQVEEEGGESEEVSASDDAPLSDLELLRQQNERLLEQLNSMAAAKGISQESAPEVTQQQQQVQQQPTFSPQAPFLASAEQLEEAIQSPEKMNALLMQVYSRTLEAVQVSMPRLVNPMINSRVTAIAAAKAFYERNPDLIRLKPICAAIAVELEAKDPTLSNDVERLFEETEKEARKRLLLARKDQEVLSNVKKQTPAFAKKPSATRTRPLSNGPKTQEDQMGEMLEYAKHR